MNVNTIAIGGDHAGYHLKELVVKHLKTQGISVNDLGPFSDESADYPDFVHPVSEQVESKEVDFGIIICGSGNGAAITANKHQGIRAALCWTVELAELGRKHNNANILALPARFIEAELALKIVNAFLSTEFEGGRHARRVDKIPLKSN